LIQSFAIGKITGDRRRLIVNFFYLVFLQGINYLLPLLTLPYLLRVVGAEYYGAIAFASSIVIYFTLIIDWGFNLTGTQQISVNRHNNEKVSQIFSSIIIIKLTLSLLCFLLLIVLNLVFETVRNNAHIIYLTFPIIIGQALFPIWFFQGVEQMKYITALNILAKVLFTLAIFVFVRSKQDYFLVPVFNSLGWILSGVIAQYIVIVRLKVKLQRQSYRTLIAQMKDSVHVFLSNMSISLYTNSTVFILGIFKNITTVGYYSSAENVIKAINGMYVPVSQTLYPFISKKAHESENQASTVIKKIALAVGAVMLFASVMLFAFSGIVVQLLFGHQLQQVETVIRILSIVPFFIAISNIFAVLGLYNLNKKKVVSRFILFFGLFHLLHLSIMVRYFNHVGAAISVAFTELMIATAAVYFFNRFQKAKSDPGKPDL
jgi:polysaccharide transporter, PST family